MFCSSAREDGQNAGPEGKHASTIRRILYNRMLSFSSPEKRFRQNNRRSGPCERGKITDGFEGPIP